MRQTQMRSPNLRCPRSPALHSERLCLDRDLEDLRCFELDAEGFKRAARRLGFLGLFTGVPGADGDEGSCVVVQRMSAKTADGTEHAARSAIIRAGRAGPFAAAWAQRKPSINRARLIHETVAVTPSTTRAMSPTARLNALRSTRGTGKARPGRA